MFWASSSAAARHSSTAGGETLHPNQNPHIQTWRHKGSAGVPSLGMRLAAHVERGYTAAGCRSLRVICVASLLYMASLGRDQDGFVQISAIRDRAVARACMVVPSLSSMSSPIGKRSQAWNCSCQHDSCSLAVGVPGLALVVLYIAILPLAYCSLHIKMYEATMSCKRCNGPYCFGKGLCVRIACA